MPRRVIRSEQFERAVDAIEKLWKDRGPIEKVLTVALRGLASHPERGHPVIGSPSARMLLTRPTTWGKLIIPRLRIVYRIQDDGDVYLYWIEADNEEDQRRGPGPPVM